MNPPPPPPPSSCSRVREKTDSLSNNAYSYAEVIVVRAQTIKLYVYFMAILVCVVGGDDGKTNKVPTKIVQHGGDRAFDHLGVEWIPMPRDDRTPM